jgi:hypothetical protein
MSDRRKERESLKNDQKDKESCLEIYLSQEQPGAKIYINNDREKKGQGKKGPKNTRQWTHLSLAESPLGHFSPYCSLEPPGHWL